MLGTYLTHQTYFLFEETIVQIQRAALCSVTGILCGLIVAGRGGGGGGGIRGGGWPLHKPAGYGERGHQAHDYLIASISSAYLDLELPTELHREGRLERNSR